MNLARRFAVIKLLLLLLFSVACERSHAWRIRMEGRVYGDVLVQENTFYAVSQAGEIIAGDVSNGNRKWRNKINDTIVASPCLSHDALFFSTQSGVVMRLSSKNGQIEWQKALNDPVIAPLTIRDQMLLIPSETGTLYALNPENGSELWRVSGYRKFSSAPLVIQNRIMIGSWKKQFLALKMNGSKEWTFHAAEIIADDAIALDGRIFVPAHDHYVYALQAQTGKLLWRFPSDRPSNLVLVNKKNPLLAFASGTDIVLLEPTSGKLFQRLKFGKNILRIYSNNSQLYILSEKVYRVKHDAARVSVHLQAPRPIYRLTFASGMILAIDDLYSIYGYASVQD